MGGVVRRGVAVASAVGVLLGCAAGMASASPQGVALGWSPTTSARAYNFRSLNPGEAGVQTFTLTNSGGPASSGAKIKMTGSARFSTTADACSGVRLGAGASCTVTVQYVPASYGERDNATLVASVGQNFDRLPLHGKALKDLARISTSASAGGPLGSTVTDTATLSRGSSPTGTITFSLYGPSTAAVCSGTAVDTEQVSVSGNGNYTTPAGATPGQVGTYWWTARYSGDHQNDAATTACGSEQVTMVPASPGITTSASSGGQVGSTVTDTATVTGGFSPTGAVTFTLYNNGSCTGSPLFTDTEDLSGGTATSNGYTTTTAGTVYWQATYNGDAGNNPVSSPCSSEPVTITPATPAITTSAGAGGPVGTTVTDTATVSGGFSPTGTITFNLYGPSATADCSGTAVDTEQVSVSGNGSYTTPDGATPDQAGTYWWTASYGGDPNNTATATSCGDESVVLQSLSTLYWANFGPGTDDGTIVQSALNGTGATTLVTGQNGTTGITVEGSHLYWADFGTNGQSNGTIMESNRDGTGVTTLATGQATPIGVTADSSHLYWADTGTTATNGAIMESNLDGTGVTKLVSNAGVPYGMTVSGGHIYWANNIGTIMESNLNGSGVTTLVTGQHDPQGIAAYNGHLYWADTSNTGTIMESNLDGSGVTTLVTGQPGPIGVAPGT